MGMGEPLHEVDNLIRALEVLCDPAGLGAAPSRITVSTVGHIAGLERLMASRLIPQLAVSVNAASDEVRRSLMPINRKWPLAQGAEERVIARWPDSKITLEYVLLAGVNDDDASADRLAAWVGDLRHVVNVIPFNAWDGAPYAEPSLERVLAVLRAPPRGRLPRQGPQLARTRREGSLRPARDWRLADDSGIPIVRAARRAASRREGLREFARQARIAVFARGCLRVMRSRTQARRKSPGRGSFVVTSVKASFALGLAETTDSIAAESGEELVLRGRCCGERVREPTPPAAWSVTKTASSRMES